MNKELKQQVIEASKVQLQVVKKPYVIVRITCLHEGMSYWGTGFAKWNTQDMSQINMAKRILKQVTASECECGVCQATKEACYLVMDRLDWNEARGIEIATGRAVKDVVKQILVVQSHPEKYKSGLSEKWTEVDTRIEGMLVDAGTYPEGENVLLQKIKEAKVGNV